MKAAACRPATSIRRSEQRSTRARPELCVGAQEGSHLAVGAEAAGQGAHLLGVKKVHRLQQQLAENLVPAADDRDMRPYSLVVCINVMMLPDRALAL